MYAKRGLGYGRQSGVTLVELIVFIVVVAVGLAGILSVINQTVAHSADPMQRKQAMAMAEAILEEVLARDANATLPETDLNTCANRALYVGVLDYACFDGVPATAVINGTNTLGSAPVPALAGLSATIVITPVAIGAQNMLRVTVTVVGGNENTALVGYRAIAF